MNLTQIFWLTISLSFVKCSSSEHQFIFKRFQRGLLECTEILQIPESSVNQTISDQFRCSEQTRQLIHCTMTLLHAWDDRTGLWRSAFVQFFEPTSYEGLFEARTNICLGTDLAFVDPEDFITQAYVTFSCFYREYGNLAKNAHLVVFRQPQLISLMSTVLEIANVPKSVLQKLTEVSVFDVPEASCLLYIFAVRGGFYNPVGGVLLNYLYNQFGDVSLLQFEKIICVQTIEQAHKCGDECVMINEVFERCLRDVIPIESLVTDAAKYLLSPSVVE